MVVGWVGQARQRVHPRPQAEGTVQGWAPAAAGTWVARALGEEITGEPATLARGCDEDMEVMPGEEKLKDEDENRAVADRRWKPHQEVAGDFLH